MKERIKLKYRKIIINVFFLSSPFLPLSRVTLPSLPRATLPTQEREGRVKRGRTNESRTQHVKMKMESY